MTTTAWHSKNGGAVIDTRSRNSNDTPSAGPLLDSDLAYLDGTPVPPPAVRCAPRRKRGALARLWRALQIAFIDWRIRTDEDYIAQCERDGILGTRSLRHFRDNVAELRVQRALLLD